MVAEVEDGALAPRQAVGEGRSRKLAEVALGRGQDEVEPAYQLGRRQHLALQCHADEAREVAQVLGEDEEPSLRHHRHRLRTEVRELLHRPGLRADVDRFVGDPARGQELLGPEAAGAARLPVHPELLRHDLSPRRAGARPYSAV